MKIMNYDEAMNMSKVEFGQMPPQAWIHFHILLAGQRLQNNQEIRKFLREEGLKWILKRLQ